MEHIIKITQFVFITLGVFIIDVSGDMEPIYAKELVMFGHW